MTWAAVRAAGVCLLLAAVPMLLRAQEEGPGGVPDSVAVTGARRVSPDLVLQTAGLVAGRRVTYRDVQRAIRAVYATGNFDDVRIEEDTSGGRQTLLIRVRERPILIRWAVRGAIRIPEGTVKGKVQLAEGRPVDPAAVARGRGRIDSLYHAQGYYLAEVQAKYVYEAESSRVRVVYDIIEGRRVAIARIDVEGNQRFPVKDIVSHMRTRPEGFWWSRTGAYDDEELRADMQERLPTYYGERGYVDFQVLSDTLLVNEETGKAALVLRVSEGQPYRVGNFEIAGNRRFSTDELMAFYPFGLGGGLLSGQPRRAAAEGAISFNQARWDDATNKVRTLYYNNGYIYVQIRPDIVRRSDASGGQILDLRWVIQEGQPAIVNKVAIVGNDVTHERVIRDAIVLLPGDVFRQDALIRSYQNISNLGFFNQPLPFPDTRPANDQGDVDVIFHVSEKHTGTVNFGASVGQGTGIGGFIGLEEPNLFGQAKRGRIQWQFGKNINDLDLSYTDPAIRESRISGTIGIHNTRARYQIADLGRIQRRGGNVQFGFPAFHDRYSRLFVSYALDEQTYKGSATNPQFNSVFNCNQCLRSTLGVSAMRDTRIDLPFATAGTMVSGGISQSGGVLGGDGDFQRIDMEGRFYVPLGQLGGPTSTNPVKFVLGMTARSGFVFGYTPFFDQLFSMGGTQFGVPLRGYDEFSVTPYGYDPLTQARGASPQAFGKSFFLLTSEVGLRISQMFYVSTFVDAGNLWARASGFNPSRLYRGAGIGLQVVSPLGPLGIDVAYGFDKVPAGWKVHFRIGNFF